VLALPGFLRSVAVCPVEPWAVFPGVTYYVAQRGSDRQFVFLSPHDLRLYLDLPGNRARSDGTGLDLSERGGWAADIRHTRDCRFQRRPDESAHG